MSVIINPRGTNGSGKTELARRIMALYGWGRGGHVERVYRDGRSRPILYRLRHPLGGRPLIVLGHYEANTGGCDTIRGVDEVFRLAADCAADGQDVLFEGFMVSGEYHRSAALAEARRLHVLRLGTPLDQCIRNVIRRRRARREVRPRIARDTAAAHESIRDACDSLQQSATVEVLAFDAALVRAGALLGLEPLQAMA